MALQGAIDSLNAMPRLQHTENDELIDLLNTLSVLHDQLTDGLDLISDCYSFQVRQIIYKYLYVEHTLLLNLCKYL